MADNFNLRAFLSENKLTKNAKLLKESTELNGKLVDTNSIEIDGDYPSDVFIISADFEDGTQLSDEEVQQLEREYPNLAGEIGYDKQTSGFDYDEDYGVEEGADTAEEDEDQDEYLKGDPTVFSKNENTEETQEEGYTPKSKLEVVIKQAWDEPDLEKAKQIIRDLIEPSRVKSKDTMLNTIEGLKNKKEFDYYLANSLLKFEKLGLNETTNKMTTKERKLVKMVQEAMGTFTDLSQDQFGLGDKIKPIVPPEDIEEGEEIADETVIPEYNTIEELMKQIDKGTNRVAEEHKVQEMKKIAKALRGEAQRMEESEHAKHINPKVRKKYLQDAIKIEKAAEKLVVALEKEAKNTKPAAASKKEETPVALAEGTFDLRKFLVENKITTNSKIIKEDINSDMENIEGWVLEQSIYEDLSPEELEALTKDYLEEWEGSKENFNSLEEYLDTVEENGDYL